MFTFTADMIRIKRNFFLIFSLLIFFCRASYAQSISRTVISSGGGTSTSGNLMLSFNIGEPVADLLTHTNGTKLSVGFMQVDIDPEVQSTPSNDISPQLTIYPNPAVTGNTNLHFKDVPDGSYQVDIVDAIGHVLYTKTIAYAKNSNLKVDLDITNFKGGTYYVRVRNGATQGKLKLVKL